MATVTSDSEHKSYIVSIYQTLMYALFPDSESNSQGMKKTCKQRSVFFCISKEIAMCPFQTRYSADGLLKKKINQLNRHVKNNESD